LQTIAEIVSTEGSHHDGAQGSPPVPQPWYGRRSFQIVHPYVFHYGSRNYLVAWSESERARDFRNFSLSDIERVEPLEKYFTRRRDFSLQAYAERSFGVFEEKQVNVVWKLSPKAAQDAKDFLFHPTQKLEPRKDGSLIVRFRAGELQEMAWHLATWGREVEVSSPAALRRQAEYAICPEGREGRHDSR